MIERAEVDPVRLELHHSLHLRCGEIHEVIRRRPHDAEHRLAVGAELNLGRAGGFAGHNLHEITGDATALHAVERAMTAIVIADAADEEDLVPELVRVGGEIQRRAAEVFGVTDHVPQNFADADDAQRSSVLSLAG